MSYRKLSSRISRIPVLIFCFLLFGDLQSYGQCTVVCGESGTIHNNDFTDSVDYTAAVTAPGMFYSFGVSEHCGFTLPDIVTIWSGNTNELSYATFTFSKTIKSIDLFIGLAGVNGTIQPETFVISTNGSVPSLFVDYGSCSDWTVTGNQVVSPQIVGGVNGVVKITSEEPFSTLTIESGLNSSQNGGSAYGLCSTSLDALLTGIADTNKTTVKAYPNPASDFLVIESKGQQSSAEKLLLYDMRARKLKEINVTADRTVIELSDLARGIYILEIRSGGKSVFEKVIKK